MGIGTLISLCMFFSYMLGGLIVSFVGAVREEGGEESGYAVVFIFFMVLTIPLSAIIKINWVF